MNVLYIGEIGDTVNTVLALSKIANKVVIINTDLTHFYNEMPDMKNSFKDKYRVWDYYKSKSSFEKIIHPKIRKLWRYVTCLFGIGILRRINRKSNEFIEVKKIIIEEDINVVVAGWGTDVIPDILFLRTINQQLPIIHYLPTFPTSQTSWLREKVELYIFKKIVHHVQGFVVGSSSLKEFLKVKYKINHQLILTFPIFYTSEYFAKEELNKLSDSDGEPHLISTGSTNLNWPGNDVFDQMSEITKHNIHVHCISNPNRSYSDPYLHYFKRFNTPEMIDGSLSTFMTQFDGCLVLYNALSQRLRYKFSIPQRFIFCFTAGIPIFMPKGIFRSCEEFIDRFKNGAIYNSNEELNSILRNPEKMGRLKRNAHQLSRELTFEAAQAMELSSFLKAVCEVDK